MALELYNGVDDETSLDIFWKGEALCVESSSQALG
jgi:hypothetical protein